MAAFIDLSTTRYTQTLRYDTGLDPQYNGNNSGITYQNQNDISREYRYDKLSRLLSARNPNGIYDERGISYDRNGNILSLSRTDNGTRLDSLAYTYNGTLFFSLGIPRQNSLCVYRRQPCDAELIISASRTSRRPRKSGNSTTALSSAPSCSQVGHASNPSVSSASSALGSTSRATLGQLRDLVSVANVKHTSWIRADRP